ncbi:heterogeneous nuclear ribonucleoprotein U isoform X4 [Plodia interpunctella]|nr:heterogeneous nuclear ribonucleoprotein U isoform X4 [Plodia interpunctella]
MEVQEQTEVERLVSPKKETEDAAEDEDAEKKKEQEQKDRPLTEEEEWEQLNERLRVRHEEQLERQRRQAEADAEKLAAVSKDPVKLNRLKRKMEKKARWSNYYKAVEITNEVLTPPIEAVEIQKRQGSKEAVEVKNVEPELDDDKITLSWYDSDLNQYLELPELNSVVPLSEGAFAHAWAGCRASHGVSSGRVCYEVRVGATATTTESGDQDSVACGLRLGWSDLDSSLHLGEGEFSWGYESSGRAVHNAEFKEYGRPLVEKDVVGVYLDLESDPCTMSYTVNGVELGVAYEVDRASLAGRVLFPHVLTKNLCYRVNFGNDRYNMLTRTKIVRNRVEIPVEQVLEEKRKIEEELQKQKEEAERRARERREERERQRQERQRKKREEREKEEKEKKEREAKERKERGEEPMEEDKEPDDADKSKDNEGDGDKEDDDGDKEEEPKENGDKASAAAAPEVDAEAHADVKHEPADEEMQEVTEQQVLKGHVLDKRIKFVIRYTVEEALDGPEASLQPGYQLIARAQLSAGPRRPALLEHCEVILMVGMPGAGKTQWARRQLTQRPQRRYNILSTGALFDKMKVDCSSFRSSYDGRWDAMVSKCAKCVLKLLEIAKGRHRNFILDQTNVYPSAQKRKLREFSGYKRIAVVIVTDEETYKERYKRREEADGKEVPDGAIVDMKANFTLPQPCAWIDEVIYPELGEEEAKKVIEEFHKEAKAAGVVKEKERRERADAPPAKRARSGERSRERDHRGGRRDGGRDREDRWGSGGGRWGPANRGGGGGGGRWGRERGPPPPPMGRDRWGPPTGPRGGDFGGGRDRDNFRGGRGGPGGPRGAPGLRGPGAGGPALAPGDRYRTDRRAAPHQPAMDKRNNGPNSQGGNMGGGGGGWQRGGRGGSRNIAVAPGSNRNMAGNKDNNQNSGQNANQQQNQQAGWNQWAGGWGGWGNWNQNPQGWGNWGNWGNWNANANAGQSGTQQAGNKNQNQQQQQQQQQWPANYTAQQWYQWQQWQQQQQQWSGYQQQAGAGNAADAQQAWAQYYQNYGTGNAAAATTNTDKK